MKNIIRTVRFTALLMALAMLLSAASLAAGGGFAGKLEQAVASAPTANKSSVWRYYNDAAARQSAGDYSGAVQAYAAAAKYFSAHGEDGNDLNEVYAYRQIAECYGFAGEYGMAAAAWRKAAERCEAYIRRTPDAAYRVQEQITFERNAAALETVTQLYRKTDDPAQGSGKYFGAPGEPVNGLVPGAYAESDPNVHNAYGTKRYWNEFPAVTGVDVGVYLLYMDYGMQLSRYESHIKAAREKGFAVELALQPRGGLAAVRGNDDYLIQLARDAEASGVQFYIRFAGEMNDPSGGNSWYTEDTAEYIRAFRAVATAFHTYAPSAAMVWSPNFYPDYNIDDYYPGDTYVDMVGVSLYMSYHPELNPLGTGVENRRWIDGLNALYSRYGGRKPMMITEGAACFATADGRDLSAFAAEQLRDLFLYLPIRYPNVKLMVWFDAGDVVGNEVYTCLTANQTVMKAYRDALRGSRSVLPSVDAPAAPVYYGRLTSGSAVTSGSVTLCSYVKGVESIASVRYLINGVSLGERKTAPYEITADLSAYRGKTVNVTVSSYYANGAQAGEETFALRVEGAPANTAYARTLRVELDGAPVTLSGYAIKDEKGNETSFLGLRELASVLNGTAARYNVVWDGVAVNVETRTAYKAPATPPAKLTGDRTYRVNTAETRVNGTAASLNGIVLTDEKGGGYVYYKLRDLGDALGFTVGWSMERGIYIET